MLSIPGLYATETWMQVFFVTGVLGGAAAWATGKAIADSWRPFFQVIFYMLLLGCAVRFAHFALFKGHLLSVPSYMADFLFLLLVGSLAYRITRTSRMVSQYRWLYERTSPVTWRERRPTS